MLVLSPPTTYRSDGIAKLGTMLSFDLGTNRLGHGGEMYIYIYRNI